MPLDLFQEEKKPLDLFAGEKAKPIDLFEGEKKAISSQPRVLTAQEEALQTPLVSPTDILTGVGVVGLGGKKLGESALKFAGRALSEGVDYMLYGGKSLGKGVLEKGVKAASVKNIEKLGTGFKSATPAQEVLSNVTKPIAQTVSKEIPLEVPKQPLPKYAGSVNLEKQDIPQAAKEIELEAAQSVLPKKVQTWKQTDKLSDKVVEDKGAEALKRVGNLEGLTVDIDASRKINAGAVTRLKEIMETSPETFDQEFFRYQEDVFKAVSSGSGEIGRALNAHKKTVGLDAMGRAFAKLEKGLNPRQKEELLKLNIDNPIEVKSFLSRLENPKFKDYFYEYWYNSILSGIPTHLVNVASNTAWSAFQVPHRALVAGVDKVVKSFTGKPREYFVKEIVPLMAGYKKSFKKGASGAWEMMKTGATRDFETKWEREVGGSTIGAFERSPHKGLRKIAPVISTPTRALRAMDVWANTMAYDAQLGALATREGLKKGLKGDVLNKFTEEFLKKPPKTIMDEAGEYAKYATFMDDPGKVTSWIIQGREKIPGGRLLIPFVNTIANLTKRGIEMTPGLGLALAKGKPTQETIAKQIEGALVSLPILYKVANGEMTGSAPTNKTEREAFYRQGKLPWSIRRGDKWYSYRRIEPLNTVVASTAIGYEAIKKAKDDEEATEIFGNIADGISKNLIDSSYLQGVTNILDRYGGRKGMVQRTLASLVPFSSFWRSINRAYEVATEGEAKVRNTKNLLGAFSQVIPGLSKQIKPTLNVWGEEIVLPGGVFRQWLPYKMSEVKNDITEQSLEKLGIYPGIPNKKVTIAKKDVELPEDVYKNYCVFYGNRAKRYLDKIFSKPNAQKLIDKKPEEMKKFIDSRLTSIRTDALNKTKLNYVKSLTPEEKRKLKSK